MEKTHSKRSIKKSFTSLLLMLTVALTSISFPKDIFAASDLTTTLTASSPKVNVNLESIEIVNKPSWETHPYKNGMWASPIKFHESRTISIKYSWDIPSTAGMLNGDYFKLPIPEAGRFIPNPSSGPIKWESGGVEKIIGTYTTEGSGVDAYAKMSLNQEAINQGTISDGYFSLLGTISNMEIQTDIMLYKPENKTAEIDYGVAIQAGNYNQGVGKGNLPGVFRKSGSMAVGQDVQKWEVFINQDNTKNMFSESPMEERNNLVVEDKLPAGTTINSNISIRPELWIPWNSDLNQVGNHQLQPYEAFKNHYGNSIHPDYIAMSSFFDNNVSKTVRRTATYAGKTYEEFKTEVMTQSLTNSKVYGVYTEADGSQRLIIPIGKQPMDITYYNWFNGSKTDNTPDKFETFVQKHVYVSGIQNKRFQWITQLQANKMKKIYGSSGSSGGKITGLYIRYDTKVINDPLNPLQNGEVFANEAKISGEGSGGVYAEQATKQVQYSASAAGASTPAREIEVTKVFNGEGDTAWENSMRTSETNIEVKVIPINVQGSVRTDLTPILLTLNKANNWKAKTPLAAVINRKTVNDVRVEEVVPSNSVYMLDSITPDGARNKWTISNKKAPSTPPLVTSGVTLEVKKEVIGGGTQEDFNFNLVIEKPSLAPTTETFTLKNGQSKKIDGLPSGTRYKLTEDDYVGYEVEDIIATSTTYTQLDKINRIIEGSILDTTTNVILFKNKYINVPIVETGNLKVTKQVTGIGDVNKDFVFYVRFEKGTSSEEIDLTKYEADRAITQNINELIFTLRHGQSITISKIPKGVNYSVREDSVAGYTTTSTGETGTIEKDITKESNFTNHIPNDGGGSSGGGGGSSSSSSESSTTPTTSTRPTTPTTPTSPTTTTPTVPATEPTTPTVPSTTTPSTTPTTSTEPTTPATTIPTYSINNMPDPNDANSPERIIVVDEDGVPLGTYVKRENPDGTIEYIIEEDVPLSLPKTGEQNNNIYYVMGLMLILVVIRQRKRK